MGGGPLLTHTRTADAGPQRPSGTQPCLIRLFICDRPSAATAHYPLGSVSQVSIGRGPDGHELVSEGRTVRLALLVADSWMSSAHVKLERAMERWVLSDLGSKNGTVANGLPVQRAVLAEGDVIEVGQTFFLYRDALPDLGAKPVEHDPAAALTRTPTREDFGLVVAQTLARLGKPRGSGVSRKSGPRFLPATVRALLAAWPVELGRCLPAALNAAENEPLAPAHLPTPLPTLAAAAATTPMLRLDGEFWTVGFGPDTVRLKDSDGLRYLAHLIERPGVEIHVSDLLGLARRGRAGAAGDGAASASADADAGDLGDAGPLLDAGARAAYKRRLEALRADADEARSFGDKTRAARAEQEIAFLASELSRAVGLGGRDRKASSAAERIRVNVTLRIRNAVKRLAASCPPLGQHLEATLRTGMFCSYLCTA